VTYLVRTTPHRFPQKHRVSPLRPHVHVLGCQRNHCVPGVSADHVYVRRGDLPRMVSYWTRLVLTMVIYCRVDRTCIAIHGSANLTIVGSMNGSAINNCITFRESSSCVDAVGASVTLARYPQREDDRHSRRLRGLQRCKFSFYLTGTSLVKQFQ